VAVKILAKSLEILQLFLELSLKKDDHFSHGEVFPVSYSNRVLSGLQ